MARNILFLFCVCFFFLVSCFVFVLFFCFFVFYVERTCELKNSDGHASGSPRGVTWRYGYGAFLFWGGGREGGREGGGAGRKGSNTAVPIRFLPLAFAPSIFGRASVPPFRCCLLLLAAACCCCCCCFPCCKYLFRMISCFCFAMLFFFQAGQIRQIARQIRSLDTSFPPMHIIRTNFFHRAGVVSHTEVNKHTKKARKHPIFGVLYLYKPIHRVDQSMYVV